MFKSAVVEGALIPKHLGVNADIVAILLHA